MRCLSTVADLTPAKKSGRAAGFFAFYSSSQRRYFRRAAKGMEDTEVPKHPLIQKNRSSTYGYKSKNALREVTADDVARQLFTLFDELGIDVEGVAGRVGYNKNRDFVAHRFYPHIAAIGELLTSWHQNPAYLDNKGNPARLRMRATKSSFQTLARLYVPHMEPKNLLSELRRVGAVTIHKNGLIQVETRSLPVYQDRKLANQHTLTSLDSFIRTLRHNLKSDTSNSQQLFHRIARNGNFEVREIPALKIRIKRQGQSFLESCDNWMLRRARPSKNKIGRKQAQVSVGVYLSVDRS